MRDCGTEAQNITRFHGCQTPTPSLRLKHDAAEKRRNRVPESERLRRRLGCDGPSMTISAAPRTPATRPAFRVGWWVLVAVFALFAVNHLAGIWLIASSPDEPQMFELFGALNLLSLVVLLVPYRRLERWAWWAMWIGIVPVGLVLAFGGPDTVGVIYVVTFGVLALAQLATLPSFRHREHPSNRP